MNDAAKTACTFRRARASRVTALAVAAMVLSVAAMARAQASSPKDADRLFRQGVALAKKGQYQEAERAFQASYDIDPARGTLLGLAMAEERAGNLVAAHAHYRLLLRRSLKENDPARQRQATAGLLAVEPRVARVVIVSGSTISRDASITLDGKAVDRDSLGDTIAVEPGSHEVRVTAPGFEDFTSAVSVEPRAQQRVDVSLSATKPATPAVVAPAPTPSPERVTSTHDGLRVAAYIAGGVGLIGLAGGTYAWTRANSTYSEVQDACPGNVCDPSLRDKVDQGKSQDNWAKIGFAVGIVGIATGVTLYAVSRRSSDASAAPVESSARLVFGPGSAAVSGTF